MSYLDGRGREGQASLISGSAQLPSIDKRTEIKRRK